MIPIIVLVIVVFALFDSVVIVPEKSSRVIQRLGKFQRIAKETLSESPASMVCGPVLNN